MRSTTKYSIQGAGALGKAWANTLGNEALALMALAERTEDAALVARARDQLVEAEAVLRDGGHDAWADTKAGQIPKAEALLARLTAAS